MINCLSDAELNSFRESSTFEIFQRAEFIFSAIMASTRERRPNAGNRMARFLDDEEDEFYKNTYGGFNDEEGDDEYKSEEEESDEVDTDFSIDEDDGPASDQDEDEPRKKKSKIFSFKSIQDQKKKRSESLCSKEHWVKAKRDVHADLSFERKSIRKSTLEKSKATERRQREREELLKTREKKIIAEYHRMTQEELLAEAKITEHKNLKSLESYQRLELERKKSRVVKHSFKGPIIRYHSVSMPLIKELPVESEKINVVDDVKETPGDMTETNDDAVPESLCTERCSRNFITFTDERVFRSYFPNTKPRVSQRNICPITRMPARYFDPVTQMAYANLQAFKVLREAYYQQLEQKGDRKQPEVAAWIEWRKKFKAEQQQLREQTQVGNILSMNIVPASKAV